jgi:hypothetical protein
MIQGYELVENSLNYSMCLSAVSSSLSIYENNFNYKIYICEKSSLIYLTKEQFLFICDVYKLFLNFEVI